VKNRLQRKPSGRLVGLTVSTKKCKMEKIET
jgi:hypothetical protein